MRPGFVILAHEHLHRAAALAAHLSRHGPVVMHVDTRTSAIERKALAGLKAEIISTRRTEWGMFGLVEATLDGVARLLGHHDDIGHVCLLSGSCLPVKPVVELADYLAKNPTADFIESKSVSEVEWVQGGLSSERLTLWFPVGWKRRRRLFDALVWMQRKATVRRRMPPGLTPHLGLQWWCLTAGTLRALLDDPKLDRYKRFFRSTWIPDESFFQTLVRKHSRNVADRSLTLQRFDRDGLPAVFHDDHMAALAKSETFFARKIDPDAEALYQMFLTDDPVLSAREDLPAEPVPEPDLFSQSWLPSRTGPHNVRTPSPYVVVVSDDENLLDQVGAALGGGHFGRLFRPHSPGWSAAQSLGNLCGDPVLRDYRPAQFLARLLLARRGQRTQFLFHTLDNPHVARQILGDENSRLALLGDEDLIPVLSVPSNLPLPRKRSRANPMPHRARYAVFSKPALVGELEIGRGPELERLSKLLADPSAPEWCVP